MERVKVGVVGTGVMGQRHCRVYSEMRMADLIGVCDVDPAAGLQIARQYDTAFYNRLDELLERADAVSLAVPTSLHYELALRCLERGVHVLVEKPMTATLPQAEALVQAAQASGLVVQVGHIERFNPTFTELRNVLEDLNVLSVNFRRLSPYVGSNQDVDVVLDLMIHDLDLVLALLGEAPAALSAEGLSISGALDHVTAQMRFDCGPLVTMTASRVTEQKVRSIEVTALEAYVECDLMGKSIALHRRTTGEYLVQERQGVKYRQESVVEHIRVPVFEPLLLELQHFLECVLHKRTPLVTPADGLNTLRLASEIRDMVSSRVVVRPAVTGIIPMQRTRGHSAPSLAGVVQ